MTIKIEIPSTDEHKPLALAIGQALIQYGGGERITPVVVQNNVTSDIKKSVETVTEQASSTETQNSAAATASNQSSEEAGKSQADVAGAGNSTSKPDTTSTTVGAVNGAQTGNSIEKLDEKGVGFNTEFCGNAAKPFFASGKNKGQWKKRQGVEQDVYDAWYAESLAAIGTGQQQESQGDNVTPINTDAAFQSTSQQQEPELKKGALTFADAGDFMQWLSEQQAAELITSADIDSAYATTQYTMGDLFDPSKAADAIVAVYKYLSNIAAGEK